MLRGLVRGLLNKHVDNFMDSIEQSDLDPIVDIISDITMITVIKFIESACE